jgi:dihydrofolate reductase/thymidylate synthase
MLSRFNIIVATDDKHGIAKDGLIPWNNPEDTKLFHDTTIGVGMNAVIMGRKTYESIPAKFKPLPERRNVVVTSQNIEGVDCVTCLHDALKLCGNNSMTFVIGGRYIYEEAIRRYAYLCDNVQISRITGDYQCDTVFPYEDILKLKHFKVDKNMNTFSLEMITITERHPEYQYLELIADIGRLGDKRLDRTGTGTHAIFAPRMEFDLRKGFPLLTTKKTWFDGIKKELLFFISGRTDTKILENQGVMIWKGNTSEEFLRKNNLPWREGDMGPGYSFQWRHSGAEYKGCDADYRGQGVDQLANLIRDLKVNPFSRRHIISAWDVGNINNMALPPCHCFVQFFVGCDGQGIPTYLDCCLYQRSSDMFLGVPFNIASYSLLMIIIGNLTNLTPRKFIHELGDAHVYLNHIDQINLQIVRTPYPFPNVRLNRKLDDIDDISVSDIILENYLSHPGINGKMSI